MFQVIPFVCKALCITHTQSPTGKKSKKKIQIWNTWNFSGITWNLDTIHDLKYKKKGRVEVKAVRTDHIVLWLTVFRLSKRKGKK